MSKKRKIWTEKIIEVMSEKQNSSGRFLWYTNGKIVERLGLPSGTDSKYFRSAVNGAIHRLIISGHVEKAHCPPELKAQLWSGYTPTKYIYRYTGKPFKAHSSEHEKNGILKQARLGYELHLKYPELPKWFRKMML